MIIIEQDDEDTVMQFLNYMYTFDYSWQHISHVGISETAYLVMKMKFHARLYRYGEKYESPGLKLLAWERCKKNIHALLLSKIDDHGFLKFPEVVKEIY